MKNWFCWKDLTIEMEIVFKAPGFTDMQGDHRTVNANLNI